MARTAYDAIVVGARCAGSPTAMLLARAGYRVLLVDRASFPSDTVSTHLMHPPGVAALTRWGLVDRVAASGCRPITSYSFDFGAFALSGRPRPSDGISTAYCPRRIVLDKLLVDAAAEAGAEVREEFAVDELLVEGGLITGVRGRSRRGRTVSERARVVVGADGRNSLVAKTVDAPQYHQRPELAGAYYTYFSDLPVSGYEIHVGDHYACGLNPTNDGLTMVVVGWPLAQFRANRSDVEGSFLHALEGFPDAFCDAERCAEALGAWLAGSRQFDDAMADYQETRDADALPKYELTCGFASFEPPSPEMAARLEAASHDPDDMVAFVSVMAGTVSAPAFFGA